MMDNKTTVQEKKPTSLILKYIIGALILSFVVSMWSNCTEDPYCDPDYLYGLSCTTCEPDINPLAIGGRAFGLYWVLAVGGAIMKGQVKADRTELLD